MTLFSLAPTGVSAELTTAPPGTFWLPPRASTTAPLVDNAFYFIFWVSVFFFALIVILMTYFVLRYRRRPGVEPQPSRSHNTALEIVWSVIPLGLVMAMFYLGFHGFMAMRAIPADADEIRVDAWKWKWGFRYPNGVEDEDLHVPVNRPIKLIMSSKDVIHSLFIPAFRIKQDLVPGRYTVAWFRATETGEFDLECAEYCGMSHSDMLAKVVVHPETGDNTFDKWLQKAAQKLQDLPPVELGQQLFTRKGCAVCHSVDGVTVKTGPNLKGIFGHAVKITGSSEPVQVDENYLRESILNPSAKVVEGFEDRMTVYKGQLRDREIDGLIQYIKSLK